MRYGSVCAGIEAASVAWHPLGWTPTWFSEIEPFPCAVLAHHYPTVLNLGDMTKYKEWHTDEEIRKGTGIIDLLVGGTPCASFSVAGLRKGLADPRGNLMLTYLAIADRYRPRWVVWENVPGVLSADKGKAFGAMLGGLAELGYGFSYRVLDAQYIRTHGHQRAVPQRRRRVFVVGYLGDWRRAAAVLFERESLSGNPPPSRKTGEEIAGTIANRAKGGGGLGTDMDLAGGVIIAGTLQASGKAAGSATQQGAESGLLVFGGNRMSGPVDIGGCSTRGGNRMDPKSEYFVLQDTRGMDKKQNGAGISEDGVAYTPDQTGAQGVFPIDTQNMSEGHQSGGLGFGQAGDPSFTPSKGHSHAIAIGVDGGNIGFAVRANPSHSGDKGDGGMNTSMVVEPSLLTMREGCEGGGKGPFASGVWRLTPRECERLQGFPDDYTLIPYKGKPAKDGPRYKALGNSMAVNCMEFIGMRIQMVEDLPPK